jgi:hypothetical protein
VSKIAVCTISRDMLHASFAFDLVNLMMFTATSGHQVTLCQNVGTGIAGQRESVAADALQKGAEYLLWLDSDHRIPVETALKLMAHNVDIVGCNYATRSVEPGPTAKKVSADRRVWSEVHTTKESKGLEVVNGLGFGCILIKAEVFKKIKASPKNGHERPWFTFMYSQINNEVLGEDLFFAWMAEECGFQLHLDHDHSKHVRHIGSFEYSLDHVEALIEHRKATEAAEEKEAA